MRKFGISILAVLLLALAAGWVFCCSSRTVPLEECSELYRHYAGSEGLEATFVQGYRINDSVRVDVTLLQATDSAAWSCLMDSLLAGYSQEAIETVSAHSGVWVKWVPKGFLGLAPAAGAFDNDFVVADRTEQRVAVFHLDTEAQMSAINQFYLRKIMQSKI